MKKRVLQFTSALLAFIMILGILPIEVFADGITFALAETSTEDPVIVVAGSDFQYPNVENHVKSLLASIRKKYDSAYGLIFAGDYDMEFSAAASQQGKELLEQTVKQSGLGIEDYVFTQGNHDADTLVTSGVLAPSGNNDTPHYGVFVINEKDYMWYNDDEATIARTAAALDEYLTAKAAEEYKKPIFVVSHLPLHYSMRTYRDGDARYAEKLFNVLNSHATAGLNIFFLYGHNHARGWDDYLGGGSVFFRPGNVLLVADGTQSGFNRHTLAFTYMNAGFTGYYTETGNGADAATTMTTFAIYEDRVEISRFDQNGPHNLKSKGYYGAKDLLDVEMSMYDTSDRIYEPTETVRLSDNSLYIPEYGPASDRHGWVGVSSSTTSVWHAVNTLTNGKRYIILDDYTAGSHNAISKDKTSATGLLETPVTVIADPINGNYVETVDRRAIWTNNSNKLTSSAYSSATYLTGNTSGSLSAGTNKGAAYTSWFSDGNYGLYTCKNNKDGVKYYICDDFTTSNEISLTDRVYLFEEEVVKTPALYVSFTGSAGVTIPAGAYSSFAEIEEIIHDSFTVFTVPNTNVKNGVYNGFLYIDDVRQTAYKLVEFNGDYYFVSDGHKIAVNTTAYLTAANIGGLTYADGSPIPVGYHTFDAEGKMKLPYTPEPSKNTVDTGTKTVVNDYVIEGTADPATAGVYTLSVKYMGVEVTKYVVTVKARAITSISCEPMVGSATVGSTTTGSVLTVRYADGVTARQYVTMNMLEGEYNLHKPGVYEDLTVVYGDQRIPGYTLRVHVNDAPEFPYEGAVRVNKDATGIDFNSTGIARVELSATGVPVKRGTDVIIMLDTSDSMGSHQLDGVTRLGVLNESLAALINDLQRDGEDGKPLDVRVSIADFSSYYGSGTPYYINSADRLSGTTAQNASNPICPKVYTGNHALDAGSMVSVHDMVVRGGHLYDADGESLAMQDAGSGANYDYAFDAVYQIASSVKEQNAENNEDRDLFVIFLSDGAPFQYNYFSAQAANVSWNHWLTGTVTDSMFASGANKSYYNPTGKHWMAEAIKGDPQRRYTVVRKSTAGLEDHLQSTGQQNIYTLPGLGATVFSVGFCLEKDQSIELDTMTTVMKNVASDPCLLYYEANTADDLHNALHRIGQAINYAATNAYFVDVMGDAFDLQMKQVSYRVYGDSATRTVNPRIDLMMYGLYTHADVEAGIITHDQIGTRNGRSMVVESVTFNAEGTEAYSNGGTENIMRDGVIYADRFWYNTNDYSVMIDSDLDGTADYLLANESFYWRMGYIDQHDMVLSYYVYLEGSMEGERTEGLYETNRSATIHYTNWRGNEICRETVSPQIPWNATAVRYAFYLVDEWGRPLVNQEMGATGSFVNRLNITTPVVYALQNSTLTLNAAELAAKDLPAGYELYDQDASYTVYVSSDQGATSWIIGKGDDSTASTYVTGYDGYRYTNVSEEANPNYDYSHTTVWFAVVYTVKPVNDVVVIDSGRPVDIQVLLNDMFYNKGDVVAVGPHTTTAGANGEALLSPSFAEGHNLRTTYEGKFGTATLLPSGIRYTLKRGAGTNMIEPEIFSYAVLYETRYYYGTVTVIPAANLYFEEGFLTYEHSSAAIGSLGVWTDIGAADPDAIQSMDRPGFNNLTGLDANNIYGYDPSYATYATLSNGGGKAVTVNYELGGALTAPSASFTFTGTGFDIISLTDNVSGTILVTVNDENGNRVASKSVNNYYGYTYSEEEGWKPDASSKDTVWQVPVIKFEGLEKGTYTVTIRVIYLKSTDELYPDGTATFVLDSIRIYDPAKGNAQADAAHKADKEFAPVYVTMKDMILGTDDIHGQETLPGVVFIDGKDATVNISDYENPGPNNELYLAKGQGISFTLTATAIPTATHVGVKMAIGSDGIIKRGVRDFLHVQGAANMYYAMNDLIWSPVTDDSGNVIYYETPVITFSHSDRDYFSNTDSVISLTGFKFTFENEGASVRPVVDAETLESGIAVMTALYAADAPEQDDTDTDEQPPQNDQKPDGEQQPPQDDQKPDGEQTTESETQKPTEETAPTDESETSTAADQAPADTNGDQKTDEETGCRAVIGTGAMTVILMLVACAFVGRKRVDRLVL